MRDLMLIVAAFSPVLSSSTFAQVVSGDTDNPVIMVVPSNPRMQSVQVDPDRREYAPAYVPPPMHRRVELSEEFRWMSSVPEKPDTVTYPDAKWIKLHFLDATNLGDRSTVTIISEDDGHSQTLNSTTLKQWNNSSALFNGDTVKIIVNVAPGERDILIVVQEVTIGIPPLPEELSANVDAMGHCNTDNRAPSQDAAVGRILDIACTGWIISNGAHLTAGHCNTGYMNSLEFQVLLSDLDGSINVADTHDQYAIYGIKTQSNASSSQAGKDWAVFGVYPNTETGLLPANRQKAFYRVTDQVMAADISLTGFGYDNEPNGTSSVTGWANEYSFTQQERQGRFIREVINGTSDAVLEYSAYFSGGDSGGPVIDVATLLTIGISTNRCGSDARAAGTGFKNQALKNAIQQFPGPNTVYVDNGHPDLMEDGSIFRPYDTVAEGLNAVPANGILSMVNGDYTFPANTVIDQPVTLSAPVGPVTITSQ